MSWYLSAYCVFNVIIYLMLWRQSNIQRKSFSDVCGHYKSAYKAYHTVYKHYLEMDIRHNKVHKRILAEHCSEGYGHEESIKKIDEMILIDQSKLDKLDG